jgi:hypothetical protein
MPAISRRFVLPSFTSALEIPLCAIMTTRAPAVAAVADSMTMLHTS